MYDNHCARCRMIKLEAIIASACFHFRLGRREFVNAGRISVCVCIFLANPFIVKEYDFFVRRRPSSS